jgi:hypothetical protein
MFTSLTTRFAAFFLACALGLQAEITLLQQSALFSEAWPQTFAGGALVASTQVTDGVNKAIPHEIPQGDYFAQSILGNDQVLKAFAFHAASGSDTVEYSLTILDYGASDGIDTRAEFNPQDVPPLAATAVFTLTKTSSAKLFFSFSGTEGLVLKKGHGYVFLIAPNGEGAARFYRVTDGTSYPDGACAKGPTYLNPQAFSPSGDHRDALFALYTAQATGGAK